MKVPARALQVGDVICVHDWKLRVIAVEHDVGTAVLTAEFDFLLHFRRDEAVEIVRSAGAPPAAA